MWPSLALQSFHTFLTLAASKSCPNIGVGEGRVSCCRWGSSDRPTCLVAESTYRMRAWQGKSQEEGEAVVRLEGGVGIEKMHGHQALLNIAKG